MNTRWFLLVLVCLPACCAVLAAPAPVPRPFETGWDKPVDPDGDCKFHRDRESLTIEVPGKEHALDSGRLMNAPRLLRDVEGDFVVQVRVSGNFRPSATSTGPGIGQQLTEASAGFVLMADEKTYVTLERSASRPQDNNEVHYYPELQVWGGGWPGLSISMFSRKDPRKDQVYLRLGRVGGKLAAVYSNDGTKWQKITVEEVELPAKLKLGLTACSTSTEVFKPRFDRFEFAALGKDRK